MRTKPILAVLTTVLLALACLLDQTARGGAQPAVPAAVPPVVPPPPGGVPPPGVQPPEEVDPEVEKAKAEAKKKKKEEEDRKAREDVKKKIEAEEKKMRDLIARAKVSKVRAVEGDFLEQYNLGVMYSNGIGVPLDYSEAFKWYQRSAKQWHPEAQYALGSVYYLGQGAAKNKIEAYAWWNLAASQGVRAAIVDREKLAQEMTNDQVTIAQRLARGYIVEKEEGERFPKPGQKKVAVKAVPVPEPVVAPVPKKEPEPVPKAGPPPKPPVEPEPNSN